MSSQIQDIAMPNGEGRFGEYGGRLCPRSWKKFWKKSPRPTMP